MSHGFAAYLLGDPTAKRAGRLSLNPLKHIDIFGLVMLAVAKFGWAKPVPVNMRNFRRPKLGMAVTALAGPLSNVVLAFVSLLFYYVIGIFWLDAGGAVLYWVQLFFLYTAVLSVGLAVFNVIPIPPLDGSKILFALIPARWYAKLMRYERYGMIALVVIAMTGVLDSTLGVLRDGLLGILDVAGRWLISGILYLLF
jgi:Zn-dependent protease